MKNTTLDWNKFKPLFGTWSEKIKPFFEGGGLDPVYSFLRTQSQAGKQIAPASMHTYRAFIATPLEELKMVIVCQEPYSKFINGSPIASGVALDCSITARTQPDLQNFYSGIEKELFDGLNLNYINDYDLSYLSSQGVLLLNVALTVEKDTPGSHLDIWKSFTEFLLKEVISSTGVPILYLGVQAGAFAVMTAKTNPSYVLSYPNSFGKVWETEGVFTKILRDINKSNGESICFLNIDPPF